MNHPNPSSNKSSSKKSTPDLDRALGKIQRKDMFRTDGITVENINAFIGRGEITTEEKQLWNDLHMRVDRSTV